MRAVFHYCGALVCAAALALSGQASAAVPVVVSPYSITQISTNAPTGGLKALATYEAKAGQTAANARFYPRAVAFSRQTIANGVKSRVALGGAVALSASILATGYVLDTITQDVFPAPGEYTQYPAGATSWCGSGPNYNSCGYANLEAALHGAYSSDIWGAIDTVAVTNWNGYTGQLIRMNLLWYDYRCPGGGVTPCPGPAYTYARPNSGSLPPDVNPNTYIQPPTPSPVSDNDLSAMVEGNPQTWQELFNDPKSFPRVLEPMPQQMTDVQAQYRIDTGLAPLPQGVAEPIPAPVAAPNSPPYPTTTPDPTGSTAPPPASQPGPVSIEFPVFCAWASAMCELGDWIREDDPTDGTPPDNIPQPTTGVDWSSGLGNGSCPVNRPVNGGRVNFSYSFQPWCDLAAMVRPVVLGAASLFVVFLYAGAGRRS